MKTISELNSKWWYRLLKVIFVLIFLTITVFVISNIVIGSAPNQVVDYHNSTFTCLAGNEKTFTLQQADIRKDSLTYEQVFKFCELPESYKTTELSENPSSYTPEVMNERFAIIRAERQKIIDLVEFNIQHKTLGSWGFSSAVALFFVCVSIIIFELFRRFFYYVALGSVKPPKN